MPFEDPWFREGKTTSPLDFERRMYEQTKNPLHVWRAYQICRDVGGGSFPEWVLEYFDTATTTIQMLYGGDFEAQDAPLLQTIADVFGFKRAGQGVRQTAFSAFDLEHRDLMLAGLVRRAIRLQPAIPIQTIVAEIADQKNTSEPTVWRAWDAWKDFLEQEFGSTTSAKS